MNRISTLCAIAAITICCLASASELTAQQTGTISGHVVDGTNGDPLVAATVRIAGSTRYGASTNTDGTYTIRNVPPGTYTLSFTLVTFGEKQVEGVVVEAGRTARQDATLMPTGGDDVEVTVVGTGARSSENAALAERQRSSTVSDAISSEQISRSGAGDAGEAMKRVTGVSVVGDKYVVVRGLSERYSATQLNGVNLPSPEPEKKVVPFDLFPSSMVSRLTTIKTFTPDNPGDFAGGLVQITTREFPESFLLSASLSTGANTEAQFGQGGLDYQGGRLDWLGIDDGTRELPTNLAGGSGNDAEAERLSAFSNIYTPRSVDLPMNRSWSLSVGNQIDVGFPVGYLLSGSYSGGFSFRNEQQRYPLLESTTDGERAVRYDYDVARSEHNVLWGGLFNLSARFAPEHKVSFKGIYNRSSDDEVRRVQGEHNLSTTGELLYTRLRYVERTLGSAQIDGEHQLEGVMNSRLEWRVATSMAMRIEPDNRSVSYFRNSADEPFLFANNFGGNNSRFFSDLDDTEHNVGIDWTVPVSLFGDLPGKVKIGGLARMRDRNFAARRFIFTSSQFDAQTLALEAEQLLTPENVRSGAIDFLDQTQSTDGYRADEQIYAGYAMLDVPITTRLRFIGGARLEKWNLDLVPVHPTTGITQDITLVTERSVLDVLPSANLVYLLKTGMNVRASATQTLARPEFRELAPFGFEDYRQFTFGNPGLEPTKIMNFDLRWEYFPRGGEVLAVSGFYKRFTDPIEQFYRIGSSGPIIEPVNAPAANSYGIEIEARKALDFIATSLENFSIGANVTLVSSEVDFLANDGEVLAFDGRALEPISIAALTNSARPLQGQSPYVINMQLGYGNLKWGTTATLLYNVFGQRLSIVGTNGIPDTYEQPRNTVDFTFSQRLPAGLGLKFAARNLLDAAHVLAMEFADGETIDIERYISGRSFSLGLSFSVDQLLLQNLD